ncbi:MAG: hypothetical protein R3E32_20755 [Chitinophagales bacterium]
MTTKKKIYLQNIVIFTMALFTAGILLQQRVSSLSHLIPVSDELWVVNATIATAETGEPQLKPSNHQVAYNANYPEEGYTKVRQYAVEYYLRAFVYKVAKTLGVEWKYLSNLFYFFLFASLPLFLYVFFKRTLLPLPTFAFLFILIGASVWASSAFHYVRYYSFTLIFVLVCHILASYCYFRWQQPLWKKIPLVLLIAWIPGGLIHTANYVLPAFWTMFSVAVILQRIFLAPNVSQKNKIRSLIVLAGLFIIGVLLASGIINSVLPFGNRNPIQAFLSRIQKVDFSFTAIEAFGVLNFNTSIFGIITTVFIVGFATWQLPILKKSGIFFWKITLASTLFSFVLLLFLLDSNYAGYSGYNRYFFVVHVQYLLFLALCLTAIYRFLVKNVRKQFSGKRVLIFSMIASPFVFSILPLTDLPDMHYNFSIVPRLTTNYQEQVHDIAKRENTLVISNHALFSLSLLDNNLIFLLSQYPDTLNTMPVNSTVSLGERTRHGGEQIYQKQADGTIVGPLGLPLIGTKKDFCRTLAAYPGWNVLLLMHEYRLTAKMEPALEKEMIQGDYLNQTLMKPARAFYYEICETPK